MPKYKVGDVLEPVFRDGRVACANFKEARIKSGAAYIRVTEVNDLALCPYNYEFLDANAAPIKGTASSNRCWSCFTDGDLSPAVVGKFKTTGNAINMIIDKIKLAMKSEPNKTLVSRGMLNADESLTAEGRALHEHVLVQKHAEEMKKLVDAVPEEKKN